MHDELVGDVTGVDRRRHSLTAAFELALNRPKQTASVKVVLAVSIKHYECTTNVSDSQLHVLQLHACLLVVCAAPNFEESHDMIGSSLVNRSIRLYCDILLVFE